MLIYNINTSCVTISIILFAYFNAECYCGAAKLNTGGAVFKNATTHFFPYFHRPLLLLHFRGLLQANNEDTKTTFYWIYIYAIRSPKWCLSRVVIWQCPAHLTFHRCKCVYSTASTIILGRLGDGVKYSGRKYVVWNTLFIFLEFSVL